MKVFIGVLVVLGLFTGVSRADYFYFFSNNGIQFTAAPKAGVLEKEPYETIIKNA